VNERDNHELVGEPKRVKSNTIFIPNLVEE